MSGDIRQPPFAKVSYWTVSWWHAALLGSFSCTCFDIRGDTLAGDSDDSDKSMCLRKLLRTWLVLHVVHHSQSSALLHWLQENLAGDLTR
jgi:hypothetical protein